MKLTYIVTMTDGRQVSKVSSKNYVTCVEAVHPDTGLRWIYNWCGSVGLSQKAACQLRAWRFTEIQIHPVSIA